VLEAASCDGEALGEGSVEAIRCAPAGERVAASRQSCHGRAAEPAPALSQSVLSARHLGERAEALQLGGGASEALDTLPDQCRQQLGDSLPLRRQALGLAAYALDDLAVKAALALAQLSDEIRLLGHDTSARLGRRAALRISNEVGDRPI